MKAVVLTAYGAPESLQLREVDRPAPKEGEVLVRVHATTVTAGDTELRTLRLPWLFSIPLRMWMGWSKPGTILGMELAGVVAAVGEGVEQYQVGDAVFAAAGTGFGAYAEYACVPTSGLITTKPEGLGFAQVAAVPIGGLAALNYLRKGGVGRGKRVLIRGASGSIGTFAVQLAKHFGAHVTGVCGPKGVARVRQLGADEVIDYTEADFADSGLTYDLILDVVGKMPIRRCLGALEPDGTFVRGTVPGLGELLRALWTRVTSRQRVVLGDAGGTAEDLAFLGGLLEAGELETVIDGRYPLERIADAHRYVETGHKQGNVIIEVAERPPGG